MRDNKSIRNIMIVLLAGLALGFLSVYAAPYFSSDDLGQIAFMLVVFFPISAALVGILGSVFLKQMWMTALMAVLIFLVVMFTAFKNVDYVYILFYVLVALIAYMVASLIKYAARKKN